jgi:hypothetical protein
MRIDHPLSAEHVARFPIFQIDDTFPNSLIVEIQRNSVCPSFPYRRGDSINYFPVLFSAPLDIVLMSFIRAVLMDLRRFLKSNCQLPRQERAPLCQGYFLLFA